MPSFDTPEPISVKISIPRGNALITASDRTDTVVEVRPTDATNDNDVKAARETRVEFSSGALLVKTTRTRSFFAKGGSVTLTIELPAGSHVTGDFAGGQLRSVGRLGDCKFNTASAAIQLEEAAELRVKAASGDVSATKVTGQASVIMASGDVNVGWVGGSASVQSASGDVRLGEVIGEVRVNSASGDISVERAHASVSAKAASGAVRLGEAIRGSAVLKTASGGVEVGIAEGTAAWLDVNSFSGGIRNSLSAAGGPEQTDETVKVTVRSYSGDVVIRRSDRATV